MLESKGNGVGRLVHFRLVERIHLAGYAVREDGTDDCRVYFAAREYKNGDIAQSRDGWLLRIMDVFFRGSMCTLYHRNHGNTYAATVHKL